MNVIDDREVQRLALKVRGLTFMLNRPAGIMRQIAEGLEHQTKVRIHLEKRDPEGRPWAPWSKKYAKTRRPPNHSLLKDTWAMVDGIDSRSTATTATVFSRRPYAGFHQAGGLMVRSRVLPARRFLGLSEQNARDLERWLGGALDALATEALAR